MPCAPCAPPWRISRKGRCARRWNRQVAPDAVIHLCHPFGDLTGAGFFDAPIGPLLTALPVWNAG